MSTAARARSILGTPSKGKKSVARRRVTEVLVDRSILAGFERRALAPYPKEHAEQLWGSIKKGTATVLLSEPVELDESKKNEAVFNFDHAPGTTHAGMTLLGSAHSHPSAYANLEPTKDDLKSAVTEKELVWAICSIAKKKTRKLIGWQFFDQHGKKLDLIVGQKK